MKKKYIDSSIKKYLDDLSAKLPAPGGGSAAAMVSSIGIALLSMVANFTIGKKGYESHQEELKEILSNLQSAICNLQLLIDDDVAAYTKVSKVYKLPKEDNSRAQKIRQALKNAVSVPTTVLDISNNAILLAERLKEIGNKNLLSDVDCGLSILRAGAESAKFVMDSGVV